MHVSPICNYPSPPNHPWMRTGHKLGCFYPVLQQSKLGLKNTLLWLKTGNMTFWFHVNSRDYAESTLEMLLEDATSGKLSFPGPLCTQVLTSHHGKRPADAGRVSALRLSLWEMQPEHAGGSQPARIAQIHSRPLFLAPCFFCLSLLATVSTRYSSEN